MSVACLLSLRFLVGFSSVRFPFFLMYSTSLPVSLWFVVPIHCAHHTAYVTTCYTQRDEEGMVHDLEEPRTSSNRREEESSSDRRRENKKERDCPRDVRGSHHRLPRVGRCEIPPGPPSPGPPDEGKEMIEWTASGSFFPSAVCGYFLLLTFARVFFSEPLVRSVVWSCPRPSAEYCCCVAGLPFVFFQHMPTVLLEPTHHVSVVACSVLSWWTGVAGRYIDKARERPCS